MEVLPTTTPNAEFPVEIIQKQLRPSYIYRLPDNNKMCHRFWIQRKGIDGFTLVCNGCHGVYLRKKKQKQTLAHPILRKAHGCSMETDPSLGHHDECKPVEYTETIKTYPPMIEETNGEKDKWGFRLEKSLKIDTYLMVYRCKDDVTRCLKFMCRRKNSCSVAVLCSTCTFIGKRAKLTIWQYGLTEDGFLEDPRLHHLPGCNSLLYGELMLNYTSLDNENTRKLIRSWSRIDEEGTNITQSKESEETTTTRTGMGVIEKQQEIVYLYQIPDSEKCLRFNAVSDGYSLKEDPLMGHSPGCKPEYYSEIVKNYRIVDSNHQPKGEYEFPLTRIRKISPMQVIFRLEQDPSKCYVFSYSIRFEFAPIEVYLYKHLLVNCFQKNTKSSWLFVICPTCCGIDSSRRKKKRSTPSHTSLTRFRRVNQSGFMEDPCIGHHPDCKPLDYVTAMKKREYVDAKTAEAFIDGTLSRLTENIEEESEETDFPSLVMQKKNAVVFVYQIPFLATSSFVFHQLVHGDNSKLFCSTCKLPGDIEPEDDVLIRKSDEFSMEVNPAENHLDHCKGQKNLKIWEGKCYLREYGKDNPQRKYAFSLDKRSRRESYCAVFRLKEDPSMCHRFNSAFYSGKCRYLTVCCGQCKAVASKEKENNFPSKSKDPVVTYRITSAGFLDDPSLRHISGCEPLRFKDLMSDYVISGEKETRDFFKHRYSTTQTHGIDIEPKIVSKGMIQLKIEGDNEKHEESDPSQIEDIIQQYIISNKHIVPIHGARRIAPVLKSSKVFTQVYDVPFFTENEVEATVTGRTLILEFKREVSAVGVESGCLRYSIDLPESVDISTVRQVFNEGQMTVSAEYENNAMSDAQPTKNPSKIEEPFDLNNFITEKNKSIYYIYRLPNDDTMCYRFVIIDKMHAYTIVKCRKCRNAVKWKKENGCKQATIHRKTDGYSMSTDPVLDHLPCCEPEIYEDVIKEYEISDENNTKQGIYEFPLLRVEQGGEYKVMHLLRKDPTLCYRFRFHTRPKQPFLQVNCGNCETSAKKKKVPRPYYRINKLGFMDDPELGHFPECKPYLVEEELQDYHYVNEQIAMQFIYGKDWKKNNIKKKLSGNDLSDGAQNQPEVFEEIEFDSGSTVDKKPSKTVKQECNVKIEDVATNMRFENGIILESGGLTYVKILDIPFFSKDEISVSIIERTVMVNCKREVSALGVAGCFLQYSLELPPSVDVSSVRTKWTGEEIEIEADRIK